MGDYEDLVKHDDDEAQGDVAADGTVTPLHIRKRWNPVTYRCAYCGASFQSRAMIRRHLEHHAERREAAEAAESTGEHGKQAA